LHADSVALRGFLPGQVTFAVFTASNEFDRNPAVIGHSSLVHAVELCAGNRIFDSTSGIKMRTIHSAKAMKQRIPLPFLILILAGIVSACSLIASWRSGAAVGREQPMQVQTVEQERIATLYFRVLTWISDVSPRKSEPKPETPRSHSDPFPVRIAKTLFLRAS
jgi:hypothetical protein